MAKLIHHCFFGKFNTGPGAFKSEFKKKKKPNKNTPPPCKKNRTEQRLINIQYMHKSEFMQNHHRQLLKVLFVCIVSIIAYSKIILTTTSVYK